MAYGARLESVLGASPRGFESPILRHQTPGPLEVPGFLLLMTPPIGTAARVRWGRPVVMRCASSRLCARGENVYAGCRSSA